MARPILGVSSGRDQLQDNKPGSWRNGSSQLAGRACILLEHV